MRKSYIGVTGFTSAREVAEVLAAMPPVTDRLLMVGVLVSWKTLLGIPAKWPRRYPKLKDFGHVFIDDPRCLNLVPDREHGATKRLAAIMERYPALVAYVQGDPRGCALHPLERAKLRDGVSLKEQYTQGHAIVP